VGNIVKDELTESKFNMWRACVAILIIDNNLDDKEKSWFESKLQQIPFSTEQLDILRDDLRSGLRFEEIIEKVADRRDKAFLLHQVRVLGHLDGNFDKFERDAFVKLETIILKKLDLEGIRSEIEELDKSSYHEDEVYKSHNESSAIEGLYKSFLKFINPGEYKFPE